MLRLLSCKHSFGFEFRCVVSAKFQEKILYFENGKKKPFEFWNPENHLVGNMDGYSQ
jgi:hypothetical protein